MLDTLAASSNNKIATNNTIAGVLPVAVPVS
jgi:hypothetical protein